MAKQRSLDVLITPAETPGIEGDRVDSVGTHLSIRILLRIVMEIRNVEIFDGALSGTPSAEKPHTVWWHVAFGFYDTPQRLSEMPVAERVAFNGRNLPVQARRHEVSVVRRHLKESPPVVLHSRDRGPTGI